MWEGREVGTWVGRCEAETWANLPWVRWIFLLQIFLL